MNKKLGLFFTFMCFWLLIPNLFGNDVIDYKTCTYKNINGQQLKAFVFNPKVQKKGKKNSAILLFHGGGWRWGSAKWTFNNARKFAELGMVAFAIDYRLSVGEITPIDAFEDTCAAFRWVREHANEFNLDPNKVVGYGVSAGGHLVAAAATIKDKENGKSKFSCKPNAMLLWSPALDLANDGWFVHLIQNKGNANDFSPVEHAKEAKIPTCIVMGEKDTLTPLAGAKKFQKGLNKEGSICEMNVYPGVGHLLTRKLDNQIDDYDPDPVFREDGNKKFISFLIKHKFIEKL